jgi:hypothetical protein
VRAHNSILIRDIKKEFPSNRILQLRGEEEGGRIGEKEGLETKIWHAMLGV